MPVVLFNESSNSSWKLKINLYCYLKIFHILSNEIHTDHPPIAEMQYCMQKCEFIYQTVGSSVAAIQMFDLDKKFFIKNLARLVRYSHPSAFGKKYKNY